MTPAFGCSIDGEMLRVGQRLGSVCDVDGLLRAPAGPTALSAPKPVKLATRSRHDHPEQLLTSFARARRAIAAAKAPSPWDSRRCLDR